LQFDYIWSASELDTAYIQDNGIDLDFDISKGQIFVNLLDKWNLVDLLYANARSGWSSNKLITGETKVQINIPQLSEIDLPQFRDNLIKLQLDVQNWIYDQIDLTNIEINSPLYNSILSYMETAETIQLRLMLVSGPLAGMALFLVYFSLALVEQRKIKLVQVMKIRGTSEDQLRIMFYGEILVSSIIAVVIGMLLSIPWAKLSLRTSDYFEFNASEIPLSIPAVWYWRLPLIGLILALDLHIYSITSLSKLRIDADQDRKVDAREPIWSKIYLDLIIFILSTLFWLVMHFYSFENEDEFSNLLDLGGVVALVAFFVSAPLIASRYFADIVGKISDILWKFRGGFLALSTRNMRNNRVIASRLAALLLMGMILSLISINISSSYIENEMEKASYELGADIYIDGIEIDKVDLLYNISGIENYTSFGRLDTYGYDRGHFQSLSILGINATTFSKAAFWRSNYAHQPLQNITSNIGLIVDQGLTERTNIFIANTSKAFFCNRTLAEIDFDLAQNVTYGLDTDCRKDVREITRDFKTNMSIIMHSPVLNILNLDIGDQLITPLSTHQGGPAKFNIENEFDYFPNFVRKLPRANQVTLSQFEGLQIVIDIRVLMGLGVFANTVYSTGAYVKLKEKANATQVINDIRTIFVNDTHVSVEDIWSNQDEIFDSDEARVYAFAFQGMIIITLIVSLIAIGYYSFITIAERKNEIGIYRAMGMVRRQIFFLMLTEVLTITISALISGLALGIFLSYNIFLLLIGQNLRMTVPPFRMIIKWNVIGIFSGVLLIISILSAILPALIISSKKTGSILRTD
jgi:ABC-type lipoprotein release transport system permease subunit